MPAFTKSENKSDVLFYFKAINVMQPSKVNIKELHLFAAVTEQ